MRAIYLWQHDNWTAFSWDGNSLMGLLGEVRYRQGQLLGRMSMLGMEGVRRQMDSLTEEIVTSSRIEGVNLNRDSVRSSIAHQLGVDLDIDRTPDHYTEGIVHVMLQATQNYQQPLTAEQLFGWHAALFPTGYSNGYKLTIGSWRVGDEPMQVVSGPMGHQTVHYQAPPSSDVPQMMAAFLQWLNTDDGTDALIRAALAHLWFVTIHPFDDGNGRITRTITEMMLARADRSAQRYYSLSAEIFRRRKEYYEVLEHTQHGDSNVTEWIRWFLTALNASLEEAIRTTDRIMEKAAFWQRLEDTPFSERQRKVLNMLWDGFTGKLNTQKWAKINHCSQDTALRDIQDLIAKGVLRKTAEGGRSTNYELLP